MTGIDDQACFRILSLDGGGIRGVFAVAFLARLEEHLDRPIASYFDLIAGTSTGGIIAIGLGLGLSARDILRLYEIRGPAIFDQHDDGVAAWVKRRLRSLRHWVAPKYNSDALKSALADVLGDRRLGESRTRLLIPAWHPVLERVYIYKTAHHTRLETDFRQPAIDAAMATAAAPTYFPPHMTTDAVELVDGGVWANNPTGAAVVEAIGTLRWPADRIRVLSIGTLVDVSSPPSGRGKAAMASHVTRLFMAGQSHSSMGTAKILTGHGQDRQTIWRVDQPAPLGRYALDDTNRISEMKSRAVAEARERLPSLRNAFFWGSAEPFVPCHQLPETA